MKVAGVVASIFAVIVLILGLTWLGQGNDFFMYKVFAPRYEQVRRQTFEQTKSYNQGMIQELQNMQFDYAKADAEHRSALASIILRRAADFDLNQPQVSAELRHFVEQLRRERTSGVR